MKKIYLLLIICSVIMYRCNNKKEAIPKQTILKGKVIKRGYSSFLQLVKKNGNYRINPINIPIINGEFSYTLKPDQVQGYQLAFKDELDRGAWMSIDFFNDADTIKFTLYPRENYQQNKIVGGELNKKVTTYNDKGKLLFYDRVELLYATKVDSLRKIKQWDSKAVSDINVLLSNEKDRTKQRKLYKERTKLRDVKKNLTTQARVIQNEIDTIMEEFKEWNANFIQTDATLFGYSLLMDKLYRNDNDPTFDILVIEKELKNYQNRFKNHPYTVTSNNLINGIKNAKVGGFYTDISAKTDEDKMISLSETISKNKLTLINLWAPWCGPCIAKDKLLKPEYSKLKEKGFGVFAVVGGIKEKKKFTETKEKYNYPWKLNYELNQEFKVWEKYNISNSGGSQFLVNSKGKILAINPYPKEIDSLLNLN